MIRADFHLHTVYSSDSLVTLDDIIRAAIKKKLDCVAITDHNTIAGALALKRLQPPFKVIVGEEIRTTEGEVIGLFLEEEIPWGLSLLTTIARIREQGGLVLLPHPCDHFRHHSLTRRKLEEVAPMVDFIEGFNGRTIIPAVDLAARNIAVHYGKPILAGSDAHTPWEPGNCGIELDAFDSPAELKQVAANGRFFGRHSSMLVHFVTKSVKWRQSIWGK